MPWDRLDAHLAAAGGTVSAYVAPLHGPPVYTRLPDATHYAASTMKVAVLAALHRAAARGTLDLDAPVPVRNDFASALPGAPRFGCARSDDNDEAAWRRVGGTATLRWLATRMIVRSSNLATNTVLAHVGLPAVAQVWAVAHARHSVTARGIEDLAARAAGITNLVTAADLAALLGTIARGATRPGPMADPAACRAMLDVLLAQEHREDLAAGLPPGTPIACKNGWVHGVRHSVGVIFPDDAAAYLIAVCATTDLADGGTTGDGEDDRATRLLSRASALVWEARHTLTG